MVVARGNRETRARNSKLRRDAAEDGDAEKYFRKDIESAS
jgi:hypothetical protein